MDRIVDTLNKKRNIARMWVKSLSHYLGSSESARSPGDDVKRVTVTNANNGLPSMI